MQKRLSPARRQKGVFFPGQERCRPGDVTVRLQWLFRAGAIQAGLGKKSLNKLNTAHEMTDEKDGEKGRIAAPFAGLREQRSGCSDGKQRPGCSPCSGGAGTMWPHVIPPPGPAEKRQALGCAISWELPICWGFLSVRRQEAVPGQSEEIFSHPQRIQPNQINEH